MLSMTLTCQHFDDPLFEPYEAPITVYDLRSDCWFVGITLLLAVLLHTTHRVSFHTVGLAVGVTTAFYMSSK